MSTVKEMSTGEDLTGKASAIALGIVAEFQVDGASIQFSTIVDRDAPAAEINAALDKLTDAGKRQELRSDLAKYRRNLIVQHREIETVKLGAIESEHRYQAETLARRTRSDELALALSEIKQADAERFHASGKRGEHSMSAKATHEANPIRLELERIMADQAAQDRVRDDAHTNCDKTVRGHQVNINFIEAEIRRLEQALAE